MSSPSHHPWPEPDRPEPAPTHLTAGFQTPPQSGQAYRPSTPTNGLAIAALVCALVGLGTFVTAPIGAVLGHLARRRIRDSGEHGAGMALAGIIVGWSITALAVGCCVLSIALGVYGEATSAAAAPTGR